jgi:hypothetical protein
MIMSVNTCRFFVLAGALLLIAMASPAYAAGANMCGEFGDDRVIREHGELCDIGRLGKLRREFGGRHIAPERCGRWFDLLLRQRLSSHLL